MSSATTNRPVAGARSTRFGDFTAPGRHNSDDRTAQTSSLTQTFGNGGTWQPSSGIWGNNTIGSGLGNAKREASRTRVAGNEAYLDGPTGSGALADTSDPWIARASQAWNPDPNSPTIQTSHNGGTSPTHVRSSIQIAAPSLAELQMYPQLPRPSQQSGYGRAQPKSNLDPSSGAFYAKPKFGYGDDKENLNLGPDSYEDRSARPFRRDQMVSQNNSYLEVGNSRDASMPPSRGSDAGLNMNGLQYGNRSQSITSFHNSSSSIHSQRPSVSGLSGGYLSQGNPHRYADETEAELRQKFSGFSVSGMDPSTSQVNDTSYSPSHASNPQGYQANGGQQMWNEGSNYGKPNGYENFANQPFPDQSYFQKSRFERAAASPAGSEHRRALNSPKYYAAGTPPIEEYRPSSRETRVPQEQMELSRRLQSIQYAQQQNYYHQFAGQYPPPPYDYPQHFRQTAPLPYPYLPVPVPAFPQPQVIPTRPAKDQDVGVGVRSMLLEEFRSNGKSNKRYELKDIYQHVVEFSGDQHGSRFIQQKLETANSDEKEQLFREIQPNALQLMTDVFGNYVIQKLFEHGNQVQKRLLAEQMKHHVMELSLQMYGCRVVQKTLEHVLADQQAQLVAELQADVMKCIKDQNGNHVVQKAIERVPTEHIQFVIDAFRGQVGPLATHPYGCRVIQRILEHCKPHIHVSILEELHVCANSLVIDQYGNYVTQHIIQHGKPEDRAKIIKIVQSQLLTLSKHKFASNVVEKSIEYGTEEQRKAIVAQLTAVNEDGASPLQLMMKDQYGNYVIQKLLGKLKGDEHDAFVEDMKPQLAALKKYNFGKQIAAIEKLIYPPPPNQILNRMAPSSIAPPTQPASMEINSSAPTPLLTNGQNSPQSSSLPSEVDEPNTNDTSCRPTIPVYEKPCPEVVINGV